jgi:hypothetical protein
MLHTWTGMRPFVAPAVALAALALAAPARAGGYVAVGLGPGADLGGDLKANFSGQGHSSGRLALGQRIGPFALEASLFGSDLTGTSALTAGPDYSTVSIGVGGKFYIPLATRLEGYLRGGLDKTWVVSRGGDLGLGYSGRGYSLGGGLQLNFSPIPIVDVAVFADYGRQFLTVRDDGSPTLDGEIGILSLGVAVGTSF